MSSLPKGAGAGSGRWGPGTAAPQASPAAAAFPASSRSRSRSRSPDEWLGTGGGAKPRCLSYEQPQQQQEAHGGGGGSSKHKKQARRSMSLPSSDSDDEYGVYKGRPPSPRRATKKPRHQEDALPPAWHQAGGGGVGGKPAAGGAAGAAPGRGIYLAVPDGDSDDSDDDDLPPPLPGRGGGGFGGGGGGVGLGRVAVGGVVGGAAQCIELTDSDDDGGVSKRHHHPAAGGGGGANGTVQAKFGGHGGNGGGGGGNKTLDKRGGGNGGGGGIAIASSGGAVHKKKAAAATGSAPPASAAARLDDDFDYDTPLSKRVRPDHGAAAQPPAAAAAAAPRPAQQQQQQQQQHQQHHQQAQQQQQQRRGGRKSCEQLVVNGILILPGTFHYLRNEDWDSSESDAEVEDCRLCGRHTDEVMLECDDCLGGFHLGCLRPPLKRVPDGDWFCPPCSRRRRGEEPEPEYHPAAAAGGRRTARERLLAGELAAVEVLAIWKSAASAGTDGGRAWVECRRYVRPEDTRAGRRPGNGRRELFRTDRVEEVDATRVYRDCFIYPPEEFAQYQSCAGADDCFFCGYHYDTACHSFTRLTYDEQQRRHGGGGGGGGGVAAQYSDDGGFLSSDGEDFGWITDSSGDGDGRGGGGFDRKDRGFKRKPGPQKRSRPKQGGGGRGIAAAIGGAGVAGYNKQGKSGGGGAKGSSNNGNRWNNSKSGGAHKLVKAGSKQHAAPPASPFSGLADAGDRGHRPAPASKPPAAPTEFGQARAALQSSAPLPWLPCRDKERAEITTFLTDAVTGGLGRSLYICGVPGTGKTVLVREIANSLLEKARNGLLPAFTFVDINCLHLHTPEHVYGVLHERLSGQLENNKRACELLNLRFSKPGKDKPYVVLVDEIDNLVNRSQAELYNLFHWPGLANSRLVVIGIANTMDLPERLLPKIKSRMGPRISFAPYTYTQLQEIITARLGGLQVFEKQALEFLSRKVSANSGDVRRALELCRRALDYAEQRLATTDAATVQTSELGIQGRAKYVALKDVDAAIGNMFQTPMIQIMENCAKYAKIFLVAMVNESRTSGLGEITFEKVALAVRIMCKNNNEIPPDTATLLQVGARLGACRLLLAEPSAKHRLQKLQLNCSRDDVALALGKDKQVVWLNKYL